MFKLNQHHQQQYPIIIVQDTQQGNISTTNDILNQLELLRYSTHLKNVDLNQFMQMTNDKDFKHYGIRKEKDCRRLSLCAESIRRTSFSSVSSTDDSASEESPVMLPSPIYIGDTVTHSPLVNNKKSVRSFLSLRTDDELSKGEQKWPNSIIQNNPPLYKNDINRRHSDINLTLPPPKYDEAQQNKQRRLSFTEGVRLDNLNMTKEILPNYTCTVQKMGNVKGKVEFKSPGIKSRFRPWKDIYMELQGTILKLYEIVPNTPPVGRYRLTPFYQPEKHVILFTLSLAHMKAELATDYLKKDHVFRIITQDGPQILIQVQTRASVFSWMDKLASGSNIAVNLEDRRMPRFNNNYSNDPLQGCSPMTRSLYQRYLNGERRDSGSDDVLI